MAPKFVLTIIDYVIVAVILIISGCIGLYFRFTGGRQRTNEEYLLAGRDMPVFPVAFSLMATFMSATTLMGIPAEMYLFGTHMAFMNIGFILGPLLNAWLLLPIYFDIGVTTSFEYLEKRFGKSIRRILSTGFILNALLFSAVSLYAPALALSAVTNLPLWLAITSVGVVCVFYCTFGGIKAVLWTDVFQAILMFVGIICIITKGSIDLGGFNKIFEVANEGGRLVVPSFANDITERYTLLSVFLQGLIITFASYGCSQTQVQRLLTVRNLKQSIMASVISIPMVCGFQLACCVCGLIFYAVFRSCDPLTATDEPIQSADQLLPYYITTAFKNHPGLPGLCIAGIFSASLSSVSSALNAMASVMVEDFIRPIRPKCASSVVLPKTFTFLFGTICVAFSFLGGALGHLAKTSLLILGLFYGVALAIYLLASLSTVANEMGSIIGVLAGLSLGTYLSITAGQTVHEILPLSNECPVPNQTIISSNGSLVSESFLDEFNSTLSSFHPSSKEVSKSISFMWITPISFLASLLVGYIFSFIFTFFQGATQDVPTMYLSPVRRKFCRIKTTDEQKQKRKHPREESSNPVELQEQKNKTTIF